jgi:hypothetical protein
MMVEVLIDSDQCLIRQHNLICSVSMEHLKIIQYLANDNAPYVSSIKARY